jgi:WD40 repeat protein
LHGHEFEVTSAPFFLDGKGIASGSEDGTVRIWDARSGECVEEIQYPYVVDVRVIAAERQELALRSLDNGLESVVKRTDSDTSIAWFPTSFEKTASSSSGLAWAGGAGNRVYLISLQGAESSSPPAAKVSSASGSPQQPIYRREDVLAVLDHAVRCGAFSAKSVERVSASPARPKTAPESGADPWS